MEVRGRNRDAIAAFVDHLIEEGISVRLTGFRQLGLARSREYEMTASQREGLLLAYRRGDFDSPRKVTLKEIAEELGITRQSLSSRLRRGTKHLIETTPER